jgi:hypothetical protein
MNGKFAQTIETIRREKEYQSCNCGGKFELEYDVE